MMGEGEYALPRSSPLISAAVREGFWAYVDSIQTPRSCAGTQRLCIAARPDEDIESKGCLRRFAALKIASDAPPNLPEIYLLFVARKAGLHRASRES